MEKQKAQYCTHCHLAFGSHEPRIENPTGTYHQSCYTKVCSPPRQRPGWDSMDDAIPAA